MYYFAYNSTMRHRLMLDERCPGSKFIGTAWLSGYALIFDGYSNLYDGAMPNMERSRGDDLWGGLFEVSEDHLKILDELQGCPRYYSRKLMDVALKVGDGSKKTQAWVYSREPHPVGSPSKEYLFLMIEGAHDCALPPEYVDSFIDIF